MPEVSINRTYQDGQPLLEADLNNIKSAVTDLNNTTLYDDDNFQNSSITTDKLQDNTVGVTQLGSNSVTSNKILANNITTAKLADSAVVTRAINDSAITTAKLATNSITTAAFDTSARLSASKVVAKSVFSGTKATVTTLTTPYSDTTVVSVTATAATRNTFWVLQPYDSSTPAYIKISKNLGTTGGLYLRIRFKKNGTAIGTRLMRLSKSDTYEHYFKLPVSCLNMLYTAGTIADTDTLSVSISGGVVGGTAIGSIEISPCKLYVIEL